MCFNVCVFFIRRYSSVLNPTVGKASIDVLDKSLKGFEMCIIYVTSS